LAQDVTRLTPDCTNCSLSGWAQDVSGTLAICGGGEAGGPGAAFVFDVQTGAQLLDLRPSDGTAGDQFGGSVAIDGGLALVGAPYDDDLGINSGSAYLFDAWTGQRLAKFVPSDGHFKDRFGTTVALDGRFALISAPYDNDNGKDSGSVYVFDTATGQQISKLLPSDGKAGFLFGFELAIDGGLALVGSPDTTSGGYIAGGAAYLFDANTGQELMRLEASDVSPGMGFGRSVAIDGTTVAIWAPWTPGGPAVYLVDVLSGAQLLRIPAPTGSAAMQFGHELALEGDTLMVSDLEVPGQDAGVIHLYDPLTGLRYGERRMPQPVVGQKFGWRACLSRGTLLASTLNDPVGGVFVFDVTREPVGVSYCGPAVQNSSGLAAELSGLGSTAVADNSLRLEAFGMPTHQPVLFLNSANQGLVQPPGSQGTMCLSFPGRHTQYGQSSGASGTAGLQLDLTDLPGPFSAGVPGPGDTWHFQAWFRDQNPGATSNFTDGLKVTFD
jgi:hypothetical protein